MKVRYQFRFYPSEVQKAELEKVFGCCRYVYNRALRLRTDAWFERQERIDYHKSSAELTRWKKDPETSWLRDVSCVPTQQALRHLNTAFLHFFKGQSRYPAFKKKRHKQSAEYTTSAFRFTRSDPNKPNLVVSGLGRLKVCWSRKFASNPTTVTITKKPSGRYFVTLCLDETFQKKHPTGKAVGVDLGINRLATLSDGTEIHNPKHTGKNHARLAKAQRILARRTKGGSRWNRQRLRVAKIHEQIGDARKDHLDKTTTDLVSRFDRICIEDLNVRGMVQNHCLARSVSDAAFGAFRQMLTYKCERYGKELVLVDRFFPSSKRCSHCGHTVEKLPLAIRKWDCPECGTQHDRDLNAAVNILSAGGHSVVTAQGAGVRRAKPKGLERSPRRTENHTDCVLHN